MSGHHTNAAAIAVGAITIAVVASTGTALAARYIELPWTNNIYQVSDVENRGKTPTVSVFDDQGTKCYVVAANTGAAAYGTSGSNLAISCVRSN